MEHFIDGMPVVLSNDAPEDKLVLHPKAWSRLHQVILKQMGFIELEVDQRPPLPQGGTHAARSLS